MPVWKEIPHGNRRLSRLATIRVTSLGDVIRDTGYCSPGCDSPASLIKLNPFSASSDHASSSPTGQSTWTSNTSRSLLFPISVNGANTNDSFVICTLGRLLSNTTMKACSHKVIRSFLSDSIRAIISQTACHLRMSPVSTNLVSIARDTRDISDLEGGAKCLNLC